MPLTNIFLVKITIPLEAATGGIVHAASIGRFLRKLGYTYKKIVDRNRALSYSGEVRIVCEGRRGRKGIHQFLDLVCDALSGLAKLFGGPVVGMVAGDPPDRRAVDLPAHVDPCGENVEFHTFAHDGPIFSQPIDFIGGTEVERDGFVYYDLYFCRLLSPL